MKTYIAGRSSRALAVGLLLGSFGLLALNLQAAVFTIPNGNSAALVAAITTANGNGQDDTINLVANGTYVLSAMNNNTDGPNGLPVITTDAGHGLFVNGNNATIIRNTAGGTPDFRIMNIASGGRATFSATQFKNGRAFGSSTGGNNSGGAIFNRGTLTLQNCTISNNAAVTNSSTVGAVSAAGGIFNLSGTVTLTNCTVSANSSTGTTPLIGGEGGGVYNQSGTITLTSSTLSGNLATRTNNSGVGSGGNGGGLVNINGTIVLRNSTISGNSTTNVGGGIVSFGSGMSGPLTLINTTVTGNTSSGGGGGIYNSGGPLTLINTTISANTVPLSGGGLYNDGTSPQLRNTIIAGNVATGPPTTAADVYSPPAVTSLGHNLIGIADPSVNSGWIGTDITGTNAAPRNPMLTALANNGGPTMTMAPQAASPAVNAGDNAVLNAPISINSDQRLFSRKSGAAVDIGAFEFGARVAAGDINGDGFIDYVLTNPTTRKTAIWNLQVNAYVGSQIGPSTPAGWNVATVGDFNSDGEKDFVLFNATTRQTAIWFLRNAGLAGTAYGPALPANWQLVAATDFNHDNQPDFVLFNQGTRQTAIWYMNGVAFNKSAFGPTAPAGSTLTDVTDFNNNGSPDFVLFNPTTRQTAISFLNGAALVNTVAGPTLPASWALQGVGDFNADGKPDYVLFQSSTRKTALWYLNGTVLAGSAYGPTLASGYVLAFP